MNTQRCHTCAHFKGVCVCESDVCDYLPVHDEIIDLCTVCKYADTCNARIKLKSKFGISKITECTGYNWSGDDGTMQ